MAWYSHLHPVMGLSARAIAGDGDHHPHDPSDLVRCVAYCDRNGITTDALKLRMRSKSPEWGRLVAAWDELVALLRQEVANPDGRAPRTYNAMRRVINDGIACDACDSTGRGTPCSKCKGSGRRSGGKCRAPRCYRGADFCPTCHGHGYIEKDN